MEATVPRESIVISVRGTPICIERRALEVCRGSRLECIFAAIDGGARVNTTDIPSSARGNGGSGKDALPLGLVAENISADIALENGSLVADHMIESFTGRSTDEPQLTASCFEALHGRAEGASVDLSISKIEFAALQAGAGANGEVPPQPLRAQTSFQDDALLRRQRDGTYFLDCDPDTFSVIASFLNGCGADWEDVPAERAADATHVARALGLGHLLPTRGDSPSGNSTGDSCVQEANGERERLDTEFRETLAFVLDALSGLNRQGIVGTSVIDARIKWAQKHCVNLASRLYGSAPFDTKGTTHMCGADDHAYMDRLLGMLRDYLLRLPAQHCTATTDTGCSSSVVDSRYDLNKRDRWVMKWHKWLYRLRYPENPTPIDSAAAGDLVHAPRWDGCMPWVGGFSMGVATTAAAWLVIGRAQAH